jgi:hypothetical protein
MRSTTQASSFRLQLLLIVLVFPVLIFFFCKESIECLPGIISRYLFNPLGPIPLAPMITGTRKCFCKQVFILQFLFSLLLCYVPISKKAVSFLFLIPVCRRPVCQNCSVWPPWFHTTVLSSRTKEPRGADGLIIIIIIIIIINHLLYAGYLHLHT